MQEVTIIGAGLVGCFMAVLLSQKGFKVTIFEAQEDARKLPKGGRAINLALSTRGINALKEINFDETVLKSTVPMYGRAVHNLNIPDMFQSYSDKYDEVLYSTSRLEFQKMLLGYTEKNNVHIHFQMKCHEIDLTNKKIIFQNSAKDGNNLHTHNFVTLFGADGAHSAVRKSLEKKFQSPDKTERFFMGYKQFNIPFDEKGKSQLNPREAFHIWPGSNDIFLTALPNIDNSYNCGLFCPLEGERSMQNFSANDIYDLFNKQFPSVAYLIENISDTHRDHPFSYLWTVNADHWYFEDKVVLIGDAAHGVIPYYGLGVNVGFENCLALKNLIETNTTTTGTVAWEKTFNQFSQRKKDTDALARLSKENAKLFHSDLKDKNFLFKKNVERELEKRYPDQFIDAHSLVSFKNISLSQAEARIKLQKEIIDTFCGNLTSAEDQLNWSSAEKLVMEKLPPLSSSKESPIHAT